MKPDIILVEPMMAPIEAALDADYHVHRLSRAEDPAALLAEIGPSVRAVVTGGGTGVSPALFDALPQLGLIAINGIGTDAVDLDKARRQGVRVTTTPGVLTDDVADLAIALMLASCRRIAEGDRLVRAGAWAQGKRLALGRSISGKRVGLFGLGRIGQAIARRVEAFSTQVSYFNRSDVPNAPWPRAESLEALARDSDILVVSVAGGAQTRGLVDRAVLDALGPEGFLVNVARGSVLDELELVSALKEGRIAGAGLDVFAHEPHVPAELFDLDNVVLMPHQGSATIETRLAMGELVLRNVAAYFAGQELPSPVT
ncbi:MULTISPECIES: 2-hydroxyacid dehydrogenase [Microvirga]|uniref:2-hydroxyacid dehydrogenase n=1 Tax=Microvirga TaxID=186650 RepID=UPI0021C61616|nr:MULTISPECIES: 2-hydroxyacid dehydrogenase [unclassified Microvirga]